MHSVCFNRYTVSLRRHSRISGRFSIPELEGKFNQLAGWVINTSRGSQLSYTRAITAAATPGLIIQWVGWYEDGRQTEADERVTIVTLAAGDDNGGSNRILFSTSCYGQAQTLQREGTTTTAEQLSAC